MNYEKILRSSWKIIKNNKVLWILGMLLGGAGFIGSGSGWNFNSSDIRSFSEEVSIGDSERVPAALRLFASDVLSAMTKVSPWVWALILVLFVVVVAIGVVIRICIKNWAEGAIIGLVNDCEEGKQITFRRGALHGVQTIKRLILISIIPYFICFGLIFVLGFVILLGFWVSPLVGVMWAFPLGTILILVVTFGFWGIKLLEIIAFRIVAIEDQSYREAYKNAFYIVKKYLIEMIVQGVINWSLGCGFGCLYMMGLLILVVPVIISFVIHPFLGFSFLLPVLLIFALVGVFVGAFNAIKSANWTLFYNELKKKEKEKEKQDVKE